MSKTEKYLQENLFEVKQKIYQIRDKISRLEMNKKEINQMLENDTQKIDSAYDVFSPQSTKNDFLKEKIENYENKVHEINQQIQKYAQEADDLEQKKEELEYCLEEYGKERKYNEDIRLIENEKIECINIRKNENESVNKEKTWNRYIAIQKNDIREIVFQCENAIAYLKIDEDRSKEILKNVIETLKEKITGQEIHSSDSDLKKLTIREREILVLIARGLLNKEIANELNITERTVKNHISNMFKKLNVYDRTQAAVFAIKNNMV